MTDTIGRLTASLADRYQIERELGQGGMATVYLAHDVRHDRNVALKVLRPELSAILGADRFLAEIKTTANLQHPHILSLFDSGESGGLVYYVMPYVDGESLRDRLNRDHQLPVDEALRIAKEVADALVYAHQHGIVHRDIKPENILLHGGHAMVADFGIALAASRSEGGARMTETGMSLGTPQYMAPEQAMGERDITPRADIYALGCVLYEMLTGEPPFTGPTAQAIVARVMTDQPRSVTGQRHTVPPYVDAAIRTALEKLPADRFANAGEFAAALDSTAGLRTDLSAPYRALTGTRPVVRYQPSIVLFIASILVLAAGIWMLLRKGGSTPVSWSYVTLGDSVIVNAGFPALTLSPDGAELVVRDNVQNGRLWLKRRGELVLAPIPGTERSNNPRFSPDGQWVLFVADNQLKKVRVAGGASVTLADSVAGSGNGYGGATWLGNDAIVYVSPTLAELRQIPAAGGAYRVLLHDSSGGGLGYPVALPNGRGILFQNCSSGCVTMGVHVLDLKSGAQKMLIPDAAQAWLLPSGKLFYVRRDGVGMVADFNLDRLELSRAAPVIERVQVIAGAAQLAWSADGSLIYAAGSPRQAEVDEVRVSRTGAATVIDTAWSGAFNSEALAPDQQRIAVGAGSSAGGLNIWIKQLDRGPFTRLTFSGSDRRPAWSPDGRTVAFVRDSAGIGRVMLKAADGSSTERPGPRMDRIVQEVTWSPDGQWLVVRTDNASAGAGDILAYRVNGDTNAIRIATSPFTELMPSFSPDGRWLAYSSNETGEPEIYVRPFPNASSARFQVSTSGGDEPHWSADGRELFFISPANMMVSAQVKTGPSGFAVTALRPLFSTLPFIRAGFHQSYDVTRDGHFLMSRAHQSGGFDPRLIQVTNWFADIRSRLRP